MKKINYNIKNTDFQKLVEKSLTRRKFVKNSLFLGLSSFIVGKSLYPVVANSKISSFDFKQVKANSLDTITIPEEYSWQTVVSWGDPLWSKGEEFNHSSRGTAYTQELAFGDNNDGMDLFYKKGRSILVVNNEYTNKDIIYGNRKNKKPESKDDINKGKAAHGISVMEIVYNNKWQILKDSKYNRRITADTPMNITGYAKGSDLIKTNNDLEGIKSLGTWNNCGNGKTPWGTYLTCEENFNGYFSSSDKTINLTNEYIRYGIGKEDWGYSWAKYDERFDISKHPNEPNRCGYIVEIDPLNPNATPKKLTSLGRFKHENAEVVIAKDNRIVVYMGDDERGEFLYKFVSKNKYKKYGNNENIFDEGQLFVAKFADKNIGKWIELSPKTTGFKSQAEICVHTRIASSIVGATTMDRPEWVASNPKKAELYCALTNNKNRGIKTNKGGDKTPLQGPNFRKNNIYGQIVRWSPDSGDHASIKFKWDLFAMAGNPSLYKDNRRGSKNINKDNMFNSPDGVRFDKNGILWIQTDGKYSNEGEYIGMGNNQMLCGNPENGEIKRFLVGPKECEITGITWSKDQKTMLVGIQHPGEKGHSNFPQGGNKTPRSSVIAIKRKDGALM